MTFLTLFSDDDGWLASDRRVYGAAELAPLLSAVEQTRALSAAIERQREDAELAVREARERGHDEGLRHGLAERREALAATVAELQASHARSVDEQRSACVALALDIVRKVAGEVAPADWLHAQAIHAATSLIEVPAITLRVHPDRADAVRETLGRRSDATIERVVGDAALAPDDCLLDTGAGTIDVSLETQLDAVVRLLDTSTDTGR